MISDLAPAWAFGPFAPDLDPGERRARLRSMRACVRLLTGPRGAALADALTMAEEDEWFSILAVLALERLAPLDRRAILASYAALA
jgi:hypothetical protein